MGASRSHHIQLPSDDKQLELGVQSLRGSPSRGPMEKLNGDPVALELFEQLFANEQKLSGGFAAFYHSYSHAALLYEVRAAVAAVLHGFRSTRSPLPRLLSADFESITCAAELMQKVKEEWGPTHSDHNANFRRVGISTMLSIISCGPECCIPASFFDGYSCKGVAFRKVLEHELSQSFGVRSGDLSKFLDEVLQLAAKHGLDTCMFGGGPSPSGHAGHILQVFVRRDLVDHLCYPAHPYGEVDEEKLPFSLWMDGDHSFAWGQARILASPKFFLDPSAVQMFAISAEPLFQNSRENFQVSLTRLLQSFLRQQRREKRRQALFCCGRARQPPPQPPATAMISVAIPDTWKPGLPLKVTAPSGQLIFIPKPPEGLGPGAVFQVSYQPRSTEASAAPAHATLTVKVPPGHKAGSEFIANYPDGQVELLTVPDGLSAGDTFEVPYAPQLQV